MAKAVPRCCRRDRDRAGESPRIHCVRHRLAVARRFVDHDRLDGQIAAAQRRGWSACEAETADSCRSTSRRDIQRRHPVEHGALGVERHHDAADAFDQQRAIVRRDGAAGKVTSASKSTAAVLALRRHVGRQRRGVAPRRDPVDIAGRDGSAERRPEGTGVALAAARLDRSRCTTGFNASTSPSGAAEVPDPNPSVTKVLPISVPVEVTKIAVMRCED